MFAALSAALEYITVWNAIHGGSHHQSVPVAAPLAVVSAVVATFIVYASLKGRAAGIEVTPDHIVVHRCWLPNRQFGWNEVSGYVRVHHCYAGNGNGSRLRLTYLAVLLESGYHVKTEGLATISGSVGMTNKTMMRLNDAESQLRELGLHYRSARHTSLAAWLFHRASHGGPASPASRGSHGTRPADPSRPGQIHP